MYECPLCGRTSNRRGDPFETEQQVIGHINGSHDPDHEGVRGEDITEHIEGVESDKQPSEAGDEDGGDGPDEHTEDADDGDTTRSDAAEDDYYEPDEVHEIVEEATEHARQEAYHEGYEQGVSKAQQSPSENGDDETREMVYCWECSAQLGTVREVRTAMSEGQTQYAGCDHCGAAVQV